jgi:phosphoribosylanthranilate isomerase
MLTQIYEIATPEEAAVICKIGVDHIGVLVGDGSFPREQPISAAGKIAAEVRSPSKLSALFLASDLSFVMHAARELAAPLVHLGAAPELVTPEETQGLKRALPGVLVMRSVPVTGPESIAVAAAYEGIVDFILLDSYRKDDRQIGALGVTHDWSISRQIVERLRTPVILAGGLGLDNVAVAIRAVSPAGGDSKTKTDRGETHTKDLEKVRLFHAAARAAAR